MLGITQLILSHILFIMRISAILRKVYVVVNFILSTNWCAYNVCMASRRRHLCAARETMRIGQARPSFILPAHGACLGSRRPVQQWLALRNMNCMSSNLLSILGCAFSFKSYLAVSYSCVQGEETVIATQCLENLR